MQGQFPTPATVVANASQFKGLRLPGYMGALGPKHLASMRKELRNKTYSQVGGASRDCCMMV